MQTQAIQNPALNATPAPARNGLQGEDDQEFKLTLARQLEAQPATPPAPARPAQAASPARPAAKPASTPAPAPGNQTAQAARQQAQSAQQARSQQANAANAQKAANSAESGAPAADAADASQAAAEPADASMEQAAASAPADGAAEAASADSAAVDPVTDMLAMVAAYNQTGAVEGAAAQAAAAAAAAASVEQTAQPAPAANAAQQEIAALGATSKDAAAPAAADSLLAAAGAGERAAVDAALATLATAGAKPPAAEGKAEAKAGKTETGFVLPAELQVKPEQPAGVQAAHAENAKPADSAALRAPAEMLKADAPAELPEAAPAQPAAPQPVAPQATQQLAQTAQAAHAAASNQLQARVGSNAWDQQLGQKVVWMVAGGDQSASLTLNPPDLGPLQVVLNVSNDQASATFSSAELEVRQAIENALPKLKEMMSEAGIQLGNATVSSGMSDQQQAFAEAAARRGNGGARFGTEAVTAEAEAPAPLVRRSALGAVDTFA
jgi:flagellar hook-length control protein FliK